MGVVKTCKRLLVTDDPIYIAVAATDRTLVREFVSECSLFGGRRGMTQRASDPIWQ